MGNVFCFGWEVGFIEWLQSFENTFTTAFAKLLAVCGEEYVLILILGLCYWCINKDLGRKVSLALVGTTMLGTLIKGFLLRRRPYMDHKSVKCIRAAHSDKDIMSVNDQGYSCPSLHAAMSASVYGSIGVNTKKIATILLAFTAPFLIGLSRPFLGVHYPTDVLAGWALGALSILVFGLVEKKLGYKGGFILILAISCIGFFYCADSEFFAALGVSLGIFLGFCFEEKFVNFEMPKNWFSYILRPALGVLVFALISLILKYPVKDMSLSDGNVWLLVYRLFRYTFSTFVTIGVYPLIFKLLKNKI